jgi:hypothetical protein
VWPWIVGALVVVASAGAAVGAGAAGARWSDERVEVLPPPVTSAAQELPVLVPAGTADLSAAGGEYALEPFDAATSDGVLAAWGVGGATAGGAVVDRVLTDGAVPHAAVCAGCSGTSGIVLGGRRDAPANAVRVLPYPRPGQVVADECGFADIDTGEVPVAVVTGNPGQVELRVGADRFAVESTDDERDEWEEWLDGPAGDRPVGSFVAHCVAVPRPDGSDPAVVRVSATDGTGVAARAVAAVVPRPGAPDVALVPLDPTMLAVDVPVASAAQPVVVRTADVDGSCAADDQAAPPAGEEPVAAPPPAAPWRPGSAAVEPVSVDPSTRPYLDGVVAVVRHVVAIPEGEPTLVCIDDVTSVGVVVTPPDARRLSLVVTDIDTPATDVEVQGTFATLGWTPCKGAAAAGVEVVLCESGGDSGAIAAAGGLLDLAVVGGGGQTVARIPLSAAPGGPASEAYRLPVPGGGTVEVAARWNDGPTGAGDEWRFARAS